MIIECPYCETRVDGILRGEHHSFFKDYGFPFKTVLLECPLCKNTLLGGGEVEPDPNWDESCYLTRLWPEPDISFQPEIPLRIRLSLEEAQRSLKAKAYHSCAVMCGRAIEGLCHQHSAISNFAGSLKDLLDRKIIDERLFKWGSELRRLRNIGAHDSEEEIARKTPLIF